MHNAAFRSVPAYTSGWFVLLGGLAVLLLAGLGAFYYMEHNGHHVTGMTNQVVWGMPHVFAVFLIVAASGALNVASIASVFGRKLYKPLAPLSALLALALLAGGLAVLVLDLGRPDRLVVAMTHYNFKSIFAWNVILYTGFFVVVGLYVWTMLDRTVPHLQKPAGMLAFLWRLTLTTGTGSIFGFLVAREAYNSAIMAPLFIAMSFAFGLAIFLLVLMAGYGMLGRPLGDALVTRLARLLAVFVAAVLYFVAVQHLTNLYITERHGVEAFILRDGGVYTLLFWAVQIVLGSLLPLVLLLHPGLVRKRANVALASLLVVVGGLAQVYVIIIGGQAYPLETFPGYEVVASGFFDGQTHAYTPSLPEIVLGLGGIGIALVIVMLGVSALRFLPASLSDEAVGAEA